MSDNRYFVIESGESVRVYTYNDAAVLTNVTNDGYLRQLVKKGRIKVVAKVTKDGTDIPLVLLNAEDVDKFAQVYVPEGEGDGARSYECRLDPEQYKLFIEAFPKVKIIDLTKKRGAYQKKYHAKKRGK